MKSKGMTMGKVVTEEFKPVKSTDGLNINDDWQEVSTCFYEHEKVLRDCKSILPDIKRLADLIIVTIQSGKKVIVLGNGGSAADAQHFVCELIGKFLIPNRKPIEAIALSCNSSIITALANDYSGNDIFARQVIAHAKEGDIVIGLSTSGKSVNVVIGLACASKCRATTVMISGNNPERSNADLNIVIPSEVTPRIQEMTILILHTVAGIVERFV